MQIRQELLATPGLARYDCWVVPRPRSYVPWIVAGGILVVLVAAVVLFAADRGARTGLSDRFDTRGQLASDFASQYLRQVAEREQRVARSSLSGAVTTEAFGEVVRSQEFAASVLLDEHGTALQVFPASPALVGQDLAARYRHLNLAAGGKVAVSDVVPSAVDAAAIVAVAVPFETPTGRRVFSSGFSITRTPLDAFVRSSVPIPGSHAYLVDGKGEVITASDAEVVGMHLDEERPGLVRTAGMGSGDIELGGEQVHYVAVPIDGTSWRMLLTVPHASLFAPLHDGQLLQSVAMVVFLVLVALLVLLALRLTRTEQRLFEKVAQLETANRTLDTFSHTLVHDLRNPLAAIGGFAQTLQHVLTDADDQVKEMMGHIETSAERMEVLIGDVLSLATVSRTIERTPCDPRGLLLEVSEAMPTLDLRIGWMPETVEADRSTLLRCFQNLLANACTYAGDEDGVARVDVDADETPWYWSFAFSDSGPGIDEADRARVFAAFERGADTTKGTGTGLGLSIVTAGAHAHGGRVRLESSESGGSRFVLEIGKPRGAGGIVPGPVGATHVA